MKPFPQLVHFSYRRRSNRKAASITHGSCSVGAYPQTLSIVCCSRAFLPFDLTRALRLKGFGRQALLRVLCRKPKSLGAILFSVNAKLRLRFAISFGGGRGSLLASP